MRKIFTSSVRRDRRVVSRDDAGVTVFSGGELASFVEEKQKTETKHDCHKSSDKNLCQTSVSRHVGCVMTARWITALGCKHEKEKEKPIICATCGLFLWGQTARVARLAAWWAWSHAAESPAFLSASVHFWHDQRACLTLSSCFGSVATDWSEFWSRSCFSPQTNQKWTSIKSLWCVSSPELTTQTNDSQSVYLEMFVSVGVILSLQSVKCSHKCKMDMWAVFVYIGKRLIFIGESVQVEVMALTLTLTDCGVRPAGRRTAATEQIISFETTNAMNFTTVMFVTLCRALQGYLRIPPPHHGTKHIISEGRVLIMVWTVGGLEDYYQYLLKYFLICGSARKTIKCCISWGIWLVRVSPSLTRWRVFFPVLFELWAADDYLPDFFRYCFNSVGVKLGEREKKTNPGWLKQKKILSVDEFPLIIKFTLLPADCLVWL